MGAVYTATLRVLGARLVSVFALSLTLLVAAGAPALAHTTGPQLLSNFDGFSPPAPGVTTRILSTGSAPYVTISLRGEHVVEILGLLGEHFLRIAPEGVSLNRKSPSLYLTKDPSKKPASLPATVDPTPDWYSVSDQPSYSYYETRAEYPHSGQPIEAKALGKPATVYRFSIPVTYDQAVVNLQGHVTWVPAPLNLEVPLLILPIFIVGVLWIEPKAKPYLSQIARAVALLTLAAAAIDGVRSVAGVHPGGGGIVALAPLAVLPGLVLIAVLAVPRALRGNRAAYLWILVLGLYLLLFVLLRLGAPTIPNGADTWLRRADVIGGALVTVGASMLLFLSSPMRQEGRRKGGSPTPAESRKPLFG